MPIMIVCSKHYYIVAIVKGADSMAVSGLSFNRLTAEFFSVEAYGSPKRTIFPLQVGLKLLT